MDSGDPNIYFFILIITGQGWPGRSVKSPQFKLMATVITIGNERPGQGFSKSTKKSSLLM